MKKKKQKKKMKENNKDLLSFEYNDPSPFTIDTKSKPNITKMQKSDCKLDSNSLFFFHFAK